MFVLKNHPPDMGGCDESSSTFMPYRIAQIEAKFKFCAGFLNLKISEVQVRRAVWRFWILGDDLKELA